MSDPLYVGLTIIRPCQVSDCYHTVSLQTRYCPWILAVGGPTRRSRLLLERSTSESCFVVAT